VAAGETVARFVSAWTVEPIDCLHALNRALAGASSRQTEYLEATVDLEILMDRWLHRRQHGRIYRGIPTYLADGYTDLGALPSLTDRRGREKIKIDKPRLRGRLVEYRRRAVMAREASVELLLEYYDAAQREIAFDSSGVNHLCREAGDQSVVLSRYLEEGVGACRHQCLAYQLCLQEAGIPSRIVKGTLRLFGIRGRHAWNLVWLRGRVALVDVALPARDGPLVIVGGSQGEVYKLAEGSDRTYLPTADRENFYCYRPVADLASPDA
jgi:transglutaminase-like putative cysteine protease